MTTTPRLLLAYYGDDFTGSTDALEFLARAGARTALFLAPPTTAQLARHPGLQAVGVAGLTRSLAPDAMATELRPAFAALRALGPRHVHYKVCSTFDSSPTVGSIGRAIEVGTEIFGHPWVPLLVGAPALGRYCVFGHLFARMGTGGTGEIHRLDRHPSMSRHPVTPAHESDLRLHLAKQTAKRVGLFDILQVSLPGSEARAALDRLVADGADVVLFDALHADRMARLGALIDGAAGQRKPLFSVGSSGLNMALGRHWVAQGTLTAMNTWADPGPAAPLLVVSGSCSPVTAGQIAWAEAHGFAHLSLDPVAPDVDGALALVMRELDAGRHTVVSTGRGEAGAPVDAAVLGTALGRIAREAITRAGLRRLVVAGGDTSSYAARALAIESVEMLAPLAPAAPLCRAFAPGEVVDGFEVVFKGGQIGAPDFFGAVARGHV
jgi:uncharacterized protein YgbK (DUF1537 family)